MPELKTVACNTSPQNVRVGRLKSVCEVTVEMRKIYRAARREEIETQQAARLVNILNLILGAIRTSDMESRLETLEASYRDAQQLL